MGLFGKKKSCCDAQEAASDVKVLGGGCSKCNALEAATIAALGELGMDTTVEHVRDFVKIAEYGVMSTPALVVDGKVVCYGRVPDKDELVGLIRHVRG